MCIVFTLKSNRLIIPTVVWGHFMISSFWNAHYYCFTSHNNLLNHNPSIVIYPLLFSKVYCCGFCLIKAYLRWSLLVCIKEFGSKKRCETEIIVCANYAPIVICFYACIVKIHANVSNNPYFNLLHIQPNIDQFQAVSQVYLVYANDDVIVDT